VRPLLLTLVLAAPPLAAQEHAVPPATGRTTAEAREGAAEEREHSNELGVFLGGTNEKDETHSTIGLEYERRLSESFGLGAVVERVDGIDAWVFLAPLSFEPVRHLGLVLYAGPGFETKKREVDVEPAVSTHVPEGEPGDGERDTFFVFRTGVGWALELGRLGLHPQVELDLARENGKWESALVFGVAVGFGF
jgi:hypothetical protein